MIVDEQNCIKFEESIKYSYEERANLTPVEKTMSRKNNLYEQVWMRSVKRKRYTLKKIRPMLHQTEALICWLQEMS